MCCQGQALAGTGALAFFARAHIYAHMYRRQRMCTSTIMSATPCWQHDHPLRQAYMESICAYVHVHSKNRMFTKTHMFPYTRLQAQAGLINTYMCVYIHIRTCADARRQAHKWITGPCSFLYPCKKNLRQTFPKQTPKNLCVETYMHLHIHIHESSGPCSRKSRPSRKQTRTHICIQNVALTYQSNMYLPYYTLEWLKNPKNRIRKNTKRRFNLSEQVLSSILHLYFLKNTKINKKIKEKQVSSPKRHEKSLQKVVMGT